MSKPVLEDLFTPAGRRNRESYFPHFAAGMIWTVIYLMIGSLSGGGGQAVFFIITLPFLVCQFFVAAQRYRDFGWTGWAVLLFFIPLIGFIMCIVIAVLPGNVGDNRYGPDPLGQKPRRTPHERTSNRSAPIPPSRRDLQGWER